MRIGSVYLLSIARLPFASLVGTIGSESFLLISPVPCHSSANFMH